MAGSRNAALSRRGLVFSVCPVAGRIRRVEPVADIDPGHTAAGESEGVDKPAQRRLPTGFGLRRIVSAIRRDWLPPLVRRGQGRWGKCVDVDRREGLLFHVQSRCGRLFLKRDSGGAEALRRRHHRHHPACKLGLAQRTPRPEERAHFGEDPVRIGVLRRETHERACVLKLLFKIWRPLAARLRIDEIGHSDGPWSFEKRLDFGKEGFPETIEWIGEPPPRLEEAREYAALLRRHGHPLALSRGGSGRPSPRAAPNRAGSDRACRKRAVRWK